MAAPKKCFKDCGSKLLVFGFKSRYIHIVIIIG